MIGTEDQWSEAGPAEVVHSMETNTKQIVTKSILPHSLKIVTLTSNAFEVKGLTQGDRFHSVY